MIQPLQRLRFADDINNHGEIVGHGVKFIDPQTHDRAFILIPVTTCYADLDGDGDMDGFDLGFPNGGWTGNCFREEWASSFGSESAVRQRTGTI